MAWRDQWWRIARETVREYFEDDGPRLSASLSFYSVLSMAPMLIFALATAGALWNTDSARAEVSRYVTDFAGPQAASVVEAVLQNASKSSSAAFATVAGVVVLVVGSTGALAELQSGLNTIWKVEEGNQVRAFIRRRLVSAVMVILIAPVLMLSVFVAMILSVLTSFVGTGSYAAEGIWYLLQQASSLGSFTLLFAAMFKLLPSRSIPWRRVWFGALVTALLFLVGKSLIRTYLEHASLESSYGAAGSVVALLLWLYYSAIIFYGGATLTSVLFRRKQHGSAESGSLWSPG
jgi:membrane protein